MDKNLVSVKKLQEDIKTMKLFQFLLGKERRENLKSTEREMNSLIEQMKLFNIRFSANGWCTYDSIDVSLIKRVNEAFEKAGLDEAEMLLVDYYKNDVESRTYSLMVRTDEFRKRRDHLLNAFEDHFADRYYASIPQFLIIADGAVNDFTRSKGFFAEGTDLTAWDCLVGCDEGLSQIRTLFNQRRNKTTTEEIRLPYRNGILHGRDLNYANEYVSAKCVSLIFALSDWMQMKNSELKRREKFEKESNPPPIRASLAKLRRIKRTRSEIEKWTPREINVGHTLPSCGKSDDYIDFPYLLPIIDMLDAWKHENYGKLSILLKKMFDSSGSDGKRAHECRELFENKKLESFEILEVEERACALSRVLVRAKWLVAKKEISGLLEFGCTYEASGDNNAIALPWANNGDWVIIPWDVSGLYKY